MEDRLFNFLVEHWPSFPLVLAFIFGCYLVLKFVALASESAANALGPVGEYFRSRRSASKAELDDMRKRLAVLERRGKAMLLRDECYFAYMLSDAEWHRKYELIAVSKGWEIQPHKSFLQFREEWMRGRGVASEVDLWT